MKTSLKILSSLLLASAGLLSPERNPPDPRLNHAPVRSYPLSGPCRISTPPPSGKNSNKSIEQIIEYYESIIADNPDCREKAIQQLGDFYSNLIFPKDLKKDMKETEDNKERYVAMAIDFYTIVTNYYKTSNYLARANLNLGKLFGYVVDPKDIVQSKFNLMVAYLITSDALVRVEALYHLGRLNLEYPMHNGREISYKKAKGYLEEAVRILPSTDFGILSMELLKHPRLVGVK